MKKHTRERRYDRTGEIVSMAEADRWVMARRPGCTPFCMFRKDWDKLSRAPVAKNDHEAPAANVIIGRGVVHE